MQFSFGKFLGALREHLYLLLTGEDGGFRGIEERRIDADERDHGNDDDRDARERHLRLRRKGAEESDDGVFLPLHRFDALRGMGRRVQRQTGGQGVVFVLFFEDCPRIRACLCGGISRRSGYIGGVVGGSHRTGIIDEFAVLIGEPFKELLLFRGGRGGRGIARLSGIGRHIPHTREGHPRTDGYIVVEALSRAGSVGRRRNDGGMIFGLVVIRAIDGLIVLRGCRLTAHFGRGSIILRRVNGRGDAVRLERGIRLRRVIRLRVVCIRFRPGFVLLRFDELSVIFGDRPSVQLRRIVFLFAVLSLLLAQSLDLSVQSGDACHLSLLLIAYSLVRPFMPLSCMRYGAWHTCSVS